MLAHAAIRDAQAMRRADADLLSLALLDARNHSLQWLAAFDGLSFSAPLVDFDPPQWLIGQVGWWQEYWIARHLQRHRGEAGDPRGLRLASIDPGADARYDPVASTRAQRWAACMSGGSSSGGYGSDDDDAQDSEATDSEALRGWLAATLDGTLELLEKADASDDGLHFFRLALQHEDLLAVTLAELAQAVDVPAERWPAAALPAWPTRGRRDSLWFPAQRWLLGSPPGGCVPANERWAHEVRLPEFDIDAQVVSWAQFAEFVVDGGYDQQRWWAAAGWDWLEAAGRRAPRHVEQMHQGVLLRRQGRLQRVPGGQAAVHVSRHEAEAWCRWAGRRLPTEPEWELAACTASSRGFVWGDVLEWVAGTAAGYPANDAVTAAHPAQHALHRLSPTGDHGPPRVLRGTAHLAPARLAHPRARRYATSGQDHAFAGFRSCAI